MGLPKLNSCCCGCSLRTGTLILLYLYLIGSLMEPFGPNQVPAKNDSGSNEIDLPRMPSAGKIAHGIIGVIVSIAGLFAVYTERHGLLMPYLILFTINIIGAVILGVILLFMFIIPGLIVLLFTSLFIYFWLVVYNHFIEIKEGRGGSSAA